MPECARNTAMDYRSLFLLSIRTIRVKKVDRGGGPQFLSELWYLEFLLDNPVKLWYNVSMATKQDTRRVFDVLISTDNGSTWATLTRITAKYGPKITDEQIVAWFFIQYATLENDNTIVMIVRAE